MRIFNCCLNGMFGIWEEKNMLRRPLTFNNSSFLTMDIPVENNRFMYRLVRLQILKRNVVVYGRHSESMSV
jgi:hypothetical protein